MHRGLLWSLVIGIAMGVAAPVSAKGGAKARAKGPAVEAPKVSWGFATKPEEGRYYLIYPPDMD